jgi:mannose-1-phosphate guanylyltransferase
VRAVVLVGGFGTRLRPLTLSTPKQMLPVAGRPMIEWVLAHLAHHGVDEVVLALGYRPDAFIDAYPDDRCAGVHLVYAVESEPLDTAGAIGFAAREGGIDERFLVVNGDVMTDIDLGALVAFHDDRGAEGTISLTRVHDPSHFGVVPTDDRGRVTAFVEKPPRDQAPTDLINAGFYVLEAEALERMAPGVRANIERVTFPAMVADGSLYALADDAYWIDVGTPERYLRASLDLVDGHRPERVAAVAGDAVVDGVVEHSIVASGARIGAGAIITDSVILDGAVVGAGARITRSIVGHRAEIGREATLDELTVVGDDVRIDDRSVLHGERVPEPT